MVDPKNSLLETKFHIKSERIDLCYFLLWKTKEVLPFDRLLWS
jgi:hypothetical protein